MGENDERCSRKKRYYVKSVSKGRPLIFINLLIIYIYIPTYTTKQGCRPRPIRVLQNNEKVHSAVVRKTNLKTCKSLKSNPNPNLQNYEKVHFLFKTASCIKTATGRVLYGLQRRGGIKNGVYISIF